MMNMYWEPFDFQLPSVPGRRGGRMIETFRPSPQDILEPGREQPITGARYRVEGRSIVVLMP
jgi:isoamylase